MAILQMLLITFCSTIISAAANCPTQQCNCEYNIQNQPVINCKGRGLTQIPGWNPSGTTQFYELILTQNEITTLPNEAFLGLNIRVLTLSNNPLEYIDINAFHGLEAHLEDLTLHVAGMIRFPMAELGVLTRLQRLHLEGFRVPSWMSTPLPSLPQLITLEVVSCGISFLSSSVLETAAESLKSLSLEHNALAEVPSDVFQNMSKLQSLNLGHNNIPEIQSQAFTGLTNLQTLDLSHNGIHTIQENSFQGLENSLTTLELSVNHVTEHQIRPIGDLSSLTRLQLSYNKLTQLPNAAFQQLSSLQHLDLHGNQLTSLQRVDLLGLGSTLEVLILAENQLQSIENGAFRDLTSLRDLYLDNQPLGGNLTPHTFQGLDVSLVKLSLQEVGFTSDNWVSVTGITSLKTLQLKDNIISLLIDDQFKNFSQLEKLDLTNNKLHEVTQKQLNGLQSSIHTLSFSKNNLTHLGHCVLYGFESLEELGLSSNPLHCDCELRWLRWRIEDMDPFQKLLNDWKCASGGPGVEEKYMKDLSLNDFTCVVDAIPSPCTDLTITTTTAPPPEHSSTTDPSFSTTISNEPVLLNITNITATSCIVSWNHPKSPFITGFLVEHHEVLGEEGPEQEELPPYARMKEITDLKPSVNYVICVTALKNINNRALDETTCADFTTQPTQAPITEPASNLSAILGAVFGVILCIVVIVIVVILIMRHKRRTEDPYNKPKKGLPTRADMPHMGYNSKRYSRPKTSSADVQNQSNKDLEKKLEGFTPEERDKILNILTTSGGSTWSNASSRASLHSQRYVPELPPRPSHLEGYLNPQKILDEEDDPEKHIYQEIGAEGGLHKECYI